MNVAGLIEFTITELTAERVVGEMPIQAGILNLFGVAIQALALRLHRCRSTFVERFK
jgi:hypothetical protein